MFSRLNLFVLLVVLDFRPCPRHQCSYSPEGFLHAIPTRLVSGPLAKLARRHRGTCKKAERMNLNWERCTQLFSVSTKGKKLHPLITVISRLFCVITQVSRSHTRIGTHTHPPPQSPFCSCRWSDWFLLPRVLSTGGSCILPHPKMRSTPKPFY